MDAYTKQLVSLNTITYNTVLNDYKEKVKYDANGNILTYMRHGTTLNSRPLAMDSLTYNYYSGTNQLRQIFDEVDSTNYTEDIDDQTDASNYLYDSIGNLIKDKHEHIDTILWNVYGKISEIHKGADTIRYTYDAGGNRISKRVWNSSGDTTTWYVRDASGNVMSVYKILNDTAYQEELHLYGSSRIGILKPERNLNLDKQYGDSSGTWPLVGAWKAGVFRRGMKFFELSNHLGNVLVTISDKKLGVDAGGDGNVDYYNPDVVTANDYYPFGQLQPGRQYGTLGRYAFNGKEQDPEVKGTGTQYDYGFRIYDPRIGRFLSVDPLTKKYPELTPYQFASNRPIDGIDLDGLEYATFRIYVDKNQKVTKIDVTTDYQLKQNGSEGPGVKYVIYRVDEGNRPDEVRWSKNMYGIYQGSKNPRLPKVGENYKILHDDYSLEPIDEADANAKQHDQDYDAVKLSGFNGVLDDKSTPANETYIKKADKIIEKQKKGEKDDVTKKPVTKEAAKAAKTGRNFFRGIENLKKLKGSRFPTQ